jgi:hypothetical protein
MSKDILHVTIYIFSKKVKALPTALFSSFLALKTIAVHGSSAEVQAFSSTSQNSVGLYLFPSSKITSAF